LAAGLAHEIRNPLASLSGSVQLLDEMEENPLHRIILREVQRLNELVEDFLQTARPLKLKPEPTDIVAMITEVVSAFRNDPRCRNLREVLLDTQPLPAVLLDDNRFRQVIWNLLVNAVQATPEGGRIEVTVNANAGMAVVAVQDNGRGIPPDKQLRIFDPFYTTRSGGTGLGLANVDRIVRGHGGTIRVNSAPGEGATFTMRLPMPREGGGGVDGR